MPSRQLNATEATFNNCERFNRVLKVRKTNDGRITAAVYGDNMEQLSFSSPVRLHECHIVVRNNTASLWLNDTSFTMSADDGKALARKFNIEVVLRN